MPDNWQIVNRPKRKPARPRHVYVSLNRRGEISLNAEAFSLIGQPASVTLLYDEVSKRIGIKYPVARDFYFFPVRRTGRGRRTFIVRAARLLKQFGVQVHATVVFKNITVDNLNGDPMLVLDLVKQREVTKG